MKLKDYRNVMLPITMRTPNKNLQWLDAHHPPRWFDTFSSLFFN